MQGMDLLDALAGNTEARSIAELSLSPLFPRSYNSIYKAIKASFSTNSQEMNIEVQEGKREGEQETKQYMHVQTTCKGRLLNITILALASNVDALN